MNVAQSLQRERPLLSEVGPRDVLLGRGTGPNENQGNKLFRDVLKKHKEEYHNAASRKEKREVVSKALEEFKEKGGRFVEKVVLSSKLDQVADHRYVVVEGAAVFMKARQAFRYLLRGYESKKQSARSHNEEEPNNTSTTASSTASERKSSSQGGTPSEHAHPGSLRSVAPVAREVQRLGGVREATSSELGLEHLASLTESPLLAGLRGAYLPHSWRLQQSPIAGISGNMFASTADLIRNSRNSVLNSPFAHGGNTVLSRRPNINDTRIGADIGRVPLLSSISPFSPRDSLLETSLGRLSSSSSPLVRNRHPVDNVLFENIDNLIPQSLAAETRSFQRLGLPSQNTASDTISRAAHIVEQVAIEHAIEKHRHEKIQNHISAILAAPNLEALGSGAAAGFPQLQQQGDLEKTQMLRSQLCASRFHALGAATAPQILDDIEKSQRALEERRRQATLHQLFAAFPGGRNPFSTGSRGSSGAEHPTHFVQESFERSGLYY